jgi:hypothetical protein
MISQLIYRVLIVGWTMLWSVIKSFVLSSLIVNAQGPDMTEEKKKYFFQDSFPKILSRL